MVEPMRPEILFPLFTPVSTLKGVGPRVAPLVERLAGPLVRDVLFTAPQSVIRRVGATVDHAVDGQVQTFIVSIDAHQPPSRLGQPWKIRAWDETGFLTLTWFKGHGPHLERQHPVGARRAVSGKVERFGSEIQVMTLDLAGVMVSAGSACSSGKVKASRVVDAMGRSDLAPYALRVSGGWASTEDDWNKCGDAWLAAWKRIGARRREVA